MLNRVVSSIVVAALLTVCGCSSEKPPESAKAIPAIVLSLADKDKLATFQKEVLGIESLTDKALGLAAEELKNVIKGGSSSINLQSVIEKAKTECLKAGDILAKKAIPEALPPEAKSILLESRAGFIAAYKAYAESFEAVRSFTVDKNPMSLLEYRKKNAEAQKLLTESTDKLKQIMTAAGVP